MRSWAVPGYTTLRDLVRDGSGHVVLARHDESGGSVAIRYLPSDAGTGARLATVITRLTGLDAPRVAPPRECAESGDGLAIVRNLVDGVALRALLVEEGAVAPEAALVVLADVLRGMAAVHDRDVVHRDCRPGTVIVTRTGGAVLVDVGVASSATRELMGAGSPFYLAPEQWAGAEPGPQADIYAATATFFECVAGAPPFFGTDPARLRDRHETALLPVDALPEPLREITRRGLAKRPQDRPITATGFLAEVEVAAVHGYGTQWEGRGRAELTRLAAGPQPPFPLDATVPESLRSPAPAAPHRPGSGRLGRTVTMAAVLAAFAVGLVNMLPAGTAADERGSSTEYVRAVPREADPALSPPDPVPAPVELELSPGPAVPAPRAAPAAPGTDEADAPAPVETPGSAPATGAIEIETDLPAPRAAPPGAPARITAVSIDSFREQRTATRLVVHVDTSSSGPVELFIGYGAGRQGDSGSTTLHTMTRQLSGHTSYAVVDERRLAAECLDYWSVVVSTEPAAGGSRDSAEVTGPPCAENG